MQLPPTSFQTSNCYTALHETENLAVEEGNTESSNKEDKDDSEDSDNMESESAGDNNSPAKQKQDFFEYLQRKMDNMIDERRAIMGQHSAKMEQQWQQFYMDSAKLNKECNGDTKAEILSMDH